MATGIAFIVTFLRGLNALAAAILEWLRGALAIERQAETSNDQR